MKKSIFSILAVCLMATVISLSSFTTRDTEIVSNSENFLSGNEHGECTISNFSSTVVFQWGSGNWAMYTMYDSNGNYVTSRAVSKSFAQAQCDSPMQ